MPLVSSVDYLNKRIYLSASTVNAALDTLDVYREVRALRRTNVAHRNFRPIIEAGGNLVKLPGISYTPAFVILAAGCYIVPYAQAQRLKITRDTFTRDGRAGTDCFDRTQSSANIDIDVDFPAIEIREVSTGGSSGPTASQIAAAVRAELSEELALVDVAVSSRVAAGSVIGADVKRVNGETVIGRGLDNDEWRNAALG